MDFNYKVGDLAMRRRVSIIILCCISSVLFCGCSDNKATKVSNEYKQLELSNFDKKYASLTEAKKIKFKNSGDKIVIGFSFDSLKEERWQKDKTFFTQRAKELGASVKTLQANSDDKTQLAQINNLISQGVDILVIVPHDAKICSKAVDMAHNAGIKVLSYDRLIANSDLDYYISFDNYKVGTLQAETVLKKVDHGNFAYAGGSTTDNNAILFRKGVMDTLASKIKDKSIRLIMDEYSKDWNPDVAYNNLKRTLKKYDNKVDAVISANDGLAGGCIQALDEVSLGGKIPVTGQDSEVRACQRIANDTQLMTVYKPVKDIADKAAELAVSIVRGENIATNSEVNNGKLDVPAVLLDPVVITKDNINRVISDGYHTASEIYSR